MITQEFRDLDLKKFKSFYYNHSNNEIYKEFNITEKDLYKIINIYNIPKRNTAKNNITISKLLKYGKLAL